MIELGQKCQTPIFLQFVQHLEIDANHVCQNIKIAFELFLDKHPVVILLFTLPNNNQAL